MSHNSAIRFRTKKNDYSAWFRHDVSAMDDQDFEYFGCEVKLEHGEGAVWIVYSEENYGPRGGGSSSRIVYPENEICNVGFRIKSARAFDIKFPIIAIFAHPDYKGEMKTTDTTLDNIAQQFPPNTPNGVSSAIALSGNWEFYNQTGCEGTITDQLDARQHRVEKRQVNNGDKARSVKLVGT